MLCIGTRCVAYGTESLSAVTSRSRPPQPRYCRLRAPNESCCRRASPRDDPVEPSGWSAPADRRTETGAAVSVGCTSATFCVATDSIDAVARWNGTTWSAPLILDSFDRGSAVSSVVSCPSSSFCMLLDNTGDAVIWNGSSWGTPKKIPADR